MVTATDDVETTADPWVVQGHPGSLLVGTTIELRVRHLARRLVSPRLAEFGDALTAVG
jgi:hypothetical protein